MEEQFLIGLQEEKSFYGIIRKQCPHAVKIEGKFKEFDFYLPTLDQKIELKSDRKSNYTGNFVVETYHYGKPSGIITTTADFWVFSDGHFYYWITPKKIKEIILVEGIRQARFIGNGDTVKKRAYLVPKIKISENADKTVPYPSSFTP